MKKRLLLSLGLVVLAAPGVRAGDHAGNGGGLAEKNVVFARLSIDRYISMCLNAKACRIEQEERVLLTQILRSLPEEGSAEKQIVFDSEAKKPGFFLIDGQVRLAKTGDLVGGPIYFNVDLMYKADGYGKNIPMSIPEAVAHLIHELGHHHGIKDHVWLDYVGSKVQSFLSFDSQILRSWDGSTHNIEVTAIQDSVTGYTQVLASDGLTVIDLSELIKKNIVCPSKKPTCELLGFRIWNLHWFKSYLRDGVHEQQVWGRLDIKYSVDGQPTAVGRAYNVILYLAMKQVGEFSSNGIMRFVQDAFRVEQLDCKKPGVFCH